MVDTEIRRLEHIDDRDIDALSEVLIDCVEGGASVGFLLPIARKTAESFWREVAASAARHERVVFAATDSAGAIIGTVQLIPAKPENQPHRADIAKMLVHRRGRRRGIGAALLAAAEHHAHRSGKTLLVLDTVTGTDAERPYAANGWRRCGEIPNYALWPDASPCPTTVFYKQLAGR